VRRYGGGIKVTSEPGKGTTFEVLVPGKPVFLDAGTRVPADRSEEPAAELVSTRRH